MRGGGGSYWPEQKHDGFLLVAALKTFIDTTFAGKGGESPKGGVKSKTNLRFCVWRIFPRHNFFADRLRGFTPRRGWGYKLWAEQSDRDGSELEREIWKMSLLVVFLVR